ncbi:hypothetical protein SAMN05660489_05642 [Pseudomonas sp. LAMO17WK12:I10]|uniref:hypothetical protein n=1 Tax=unclassified Pseudomonas TaxID=196821 RepID=UPI000BD9309A|nr:MULTISPECIES: hypothetical protein [unclassified Pseudomonas]PXX54810.1 hypothetical protein H160_05636 [Pseudomonas sp. LAMO17WK12:I9]SNY51225.1 hypothetical protein SAMN05660489_05642 [Pseudomonas sp. LAMO17WK12:I10]
MSEFSFQLRCVQFSGPTDERHVDFFDGVNVICGASDTGKSYLAETIDYMLGGSELRKIDELEGYDRITLSLESGSGEEWSLERALNGGGFKLIEGGQDESAVLKATHSHGITDNLSGFLLDKLGLLGKKVLKSSAKSTLQSLGFRNIARLVIVQEEEIATKGSPFWSGQFTTKTSDLATVKLLVTGMDDSAINTPVVKVIDNSGKISLLDDLISELTADVGDSSREELEAQLEKIGIRLERHRKSIALNEELISELLERRQNNVFQRQLVSERIDEIADLFTRFDLLRDHYDVDLARLEAIEESGSMLVYVDEVDCPMCGAAPCNQHLEDDDEADIRSAVLAASAEIAKIEKLRIDLVGTIEELQIESEELSKGYLGQQKEYAEIEASLKEVLSPRKDEEKIDFEALVELRQDVSKKINGFERIEHLIQRKLSLEKEGSSAGGKTTAVVSIPDTIGNSLSDKISSILNEWNFPGECRVVFDKTSSDFIIDGKPRGSRGKGLRSITHAAVSLGLLEYAQENSLPHPGFLVLDSPLLAYFAPEGDDELLLKGSNLKEKFYEYLIRHHSSGSQIVIIENQHPPLEAMRDVHLTVFTNNPYEGRAGLL